MSVYVVGFCVLEGDVLLHTSVAPRDLQSLTLSFACAESPAPMFGKVATTATI